MLENFIELFTIPSDIWIKCILMTFPLIFCNFIFYKKIIGKPAEFQYEMLKTYTLFIVLMTIVFTIANYILINYGIEGMKLLPTNKAFICSKFVFYCYVTCTTLWHSILISIIKSTKGIVC